jgi:MinD-like ATPase involved in chromosome partitioning or flagellar assembly
VIFPATSGGGIALATETKIPFLGSIPLDPLLARACDEGKDFCSEYSDSPTSLAVKSIIKCLQN